MSEKLILTGMVLLAAPVGDFDKRIVILTKERGRITAFARGARRQNSQLLAVANPFVFGEFELFEGRDAYSLSKANVIQYFREIAISPETACYGFYFLEIANYYTRENNDEREMLKLLYQSMRALISTKIENGLIRVIYELKSMVINGEYPNLFSCQKCGKKEELTNFNTSAGGALCTVCGSIFGGIPMNISTVYTMQFIIVTPVEKLFSFQVSEQVLEQLQIIMKTYMERYIDQKFSSLDILEQEMNINS